MITRLPQGVYSEIPPKISTGIHFLKYFSNIVPKIAPGTQYKMYSKNLAGIIAVKFYF